MFTSNIVIQKLLRYAILCIAATVVLIFPYPGAIAQVVINSDEGAVYVYGNATLPYSWQSTPPSISGSFNNHTVQINPGGKVGYSVYGAYTVTGDVENNHVIMTEGQVSNNIYGGYTQSGDAIGNTVTIYSMGGGAL